MLNTALIFKHANLRQAFITLFKKQHSKEIGTLEAYILDESPRVIAAAMIEEIISKARPEVDSSIAFQQLMFRCHQNIFDEGLGLKPEKDTSYADEKDIPKLKNRI